MAPASSRLFAEELSVVDSRLFTPSRSASPTRAADGVEPSVTRETSRMAIDMRAFYDSPQLSDVTLALAGRDGDCRLRGHRLVLGASSTYFKTLFSETWSPQSESGAAAPEVSLHSEELLAHVVLLCEYLYGREIEIDLTSAHPLLRLADFYGVEALACLCMGFLERVLHPEPARCFTLFDAEAGAGGAPQLPSQPRLLALCTEVLARSFAEASAHEAFNRCPVELLHAVLERDDLGNEHGEAHVLRALLAWASADEEARVGALGPLLGLVRWPTMDGELLADIEESHPLLSLDSVGDPLRDLLLEALRYQAASPQRKASLARGASGVSARRYRPRTPNMVRLQGDGKYCWLLKNFSRLAEEVSLRPRAFSRILSHPGFPHIRSASTRRPSASRASPSCCSSSRAV